MDDGFLVTGAFVKEYSMRIGTTEIYMKDGKWTSRKPFGNEWRKEMKQFKKSQLIELLREAWMKAQGIKED